MTSWANWLPIVALLVGDGKEVESDLFLLGFIECSYCGFNKNGTVPEHNITKTSIIFILYNRDLDRN